MAGNKLWGKWVDADGVTRRGTFNESLRLRIMEQERDVRFELQQQLHARVRAWKEAACGEAAKLHAEVWNKNGMVRSLKGVDMLTPEELDEFERRLSTLKY